MDEEIWDEHQWEEFLQEADRRTELYHQLFEAYLRDNPPPEEDAPEELREEYWEAVHEHVAEQMGWNDRGEDDEDDTPDWLAEIDSDDDSVADDDGEAWKTGLTDEFPERQDFRDLPVYQKAYALGLDVHRWVEALDQAHKESAMVELCANAMQIAAKLARAHAYGYEIDTIGGNIAECKRALAAANRTLDALRYFRDSDLIPAADYMRLYEQAFEVRNAIGLRVQELREQFERGVE